MSIFFADNGDQLWDRVIVILIDEALSLFGECIYGFWRPPRDGISVSVILSALVIKSMSDLVAYDNTNSTIVQVSKYGRKLKEKSKLESKLKLKLEFFASRNHLGYPAPKNAGCKIPAGKAKKKYECKYIAPKCKKKIIKKTNQNIFTFQNVNTSKCKIQNVRVQQLTQVNFESF